MKYYILGVFAVLLLVMLLTIATDIFGNYIEIRASNMIVMKKCKKTNMYSITDYGDAVPIYDCSNVEKKEK